MIIHGIIRPKTHQMACYFGKTQQYNGYIFPLSYQSNIIHNPSQANHSIGSSDFFAPLCKFNGRNFTCCMVQFDDLRLGWVDQKG